MNGTLDSDTDSGHEPGAQRRTRWIRRIRWLGAALGLFLLIGASTFVACTRPAPPANPNAPRPQPVSVELTVDGRPVRVHALPTGTIQIKHCHHDLCVPESASYGRRFLSILADDQFVEPMPIWTYLIEHPEGRFVVDTGGTEDWADSEAWSCDPISARVSRSMARVDVRAGEALVDRLGSLDLRPQDIDAAIITHLHFDHTAGVESLGIPTYVGQGDLDAAQMIGATPCRFLEGAALVAVEPLAAQHAPRASDLGDQLLGAGAPLTEDGRVRVYPTPGHTPGSLTIRLQADQGDVWFVGDTTFDEQALDPTGPTASIHVLFDAVRSLQSDFSTLMEQTGALILPAHDDDAGDRLTRFGAVRP